MDNCTNESEFFNKCFDKHNFNELNNLDVNILHNSILYYKNKYINNNKKVELYQQSFFASVIPPFFFYRRVSYL